MRGIAARFSIGKVEGMTTDSHLTAQVWLTQSGKTLTWLAERVGVSVAHMSLVLSGRRGLSYEKACAASTATGGVVPFQAFLISDERRAARKASESVGWVGGKKGIGRPRKVMGKQEAAI